MKTKTLLLLILLAGSSLLLAGCDIFDGSPVASYTCNSCNYHRPDVVIQTEPEPEYWKVTLEATQSYDPDGEITDYSWDFDNEESGSGEKVTHIYNLGKYNPTLTVTDNDGETDQTQEGAISTGRELTPPSWIRGDWSNEDGTITFTFSPDNVIQESDKNSIYRNLQNEATDPTECETETIYSVKAGLIGANWYYYFKKIDQNSIGYELLNEGAYPDSSPELEEEAILNRE